MAYEGIDTTGALHLTLVAYPYGAENRYQRHTFRQSDNDKSEVETGITLPKIKKLECAAIKILNEYRNVPTTIHPVLKNITTPKMLTMHDVNTPSQAPNSFGERRLKSARHHGSSSMGHVSKLAHIVSNQNDQTNKRKNYHDYLLLWIFI